MPSSSKGSKKHILVLAGVLLLGGVAAASAVLYSSYSDDNDDDRAKVSVDFKELSEDMVDEQLSQEAAKALLDTDTSGFSDDDLFTHYLELAESLLAATEYEAAADLYGLAGEAKPTEYSVYVAKAEALILAEDEDGAKEAYAKALEAFKESGAEGVEQYERYIEDQISGTRSSIQFGPYDGRTKDDSPTDSSGEDEE